MRFSRLMGLVWLLVLFLVMLVSSVGAADEYVLGTGVSCSGGFSSCASAMDDNWGTSAYRDISPQSWAQVDIDYSPAVFVDAIKVVVNGDTFWDNIKNVQVYVGEEGGGYALVSNDAECNGTCQYTPTFAERWVDRVYVKAYNSNSLNGGDFRVYEMQLWTAQAPATPTPTPTITPVPIPPFFGGPEVGDLVYMLGVSTNMVWTVLPFLLLVVGVAVGVWLFSWWVDKRRGVVGR